MKTDVDTRAPATRPAGNVLAPFLFTMRTKGPAGLAMRMATVAGRFGPTPQLMTRRLDRMIDAAVDAGFRPSCPITATVLVRHPQVGRTLVDRGMELAVHGLRHNDHLAEDADAQLRDIALAVEVFHRCGIEPTGFRAPYLRADAGTAAAVRAAGLSYQSDDAVVFDSGLLGVPTVGAAYDRAITMYDAKQAATTCTRPSLVDGLVRIPVCLPDDEMLLDRLHLPEEQRVQAWLAIFELTRARGDLFTMQMHPERFVRSAGAVEAVLSLARSLGTVWTARMDEIADWWRRRSACSIEVRTDSGDADEFVLHGDPQARMRLVGGSDATRTDRSPVRALRHDAGLLPMVSVTPDVPAAAVAFLEEDGFLVTSSPPRRCAVELSGGAAEDHLALRRSILDAEFPVLAVDRWPNGATSALALTGDIDALTVQDFVHRVRENAHGVPAWISGEAI